MTDRVKTLQSRSHFLKETAHQIEVLEEHRSHPTFEEKLTSLGAFPLRPAKLEILQINVGKMCNQTCKHCHVDAGPDRKEIMTVETMKECLGLIDSEKVTTVDITGGAPELNPNFRWLVEQLSDRGVDIMVRCNLTIITANPRFNDLPEFYRDHQVEVISSLPHFSRLRTDSQRGDGVFDQSIRALRMLNDQGYGHKGTGLKLHLVYNPTGAFLPGPQHELEKEFKDRLSTKHGVVFNQLYTITNMPISRFLDYLLVSGNHNMYMEKLISSFNPQTIEGLMCRNTLSVGWDGYLYDCDFNQMLDLKIDVPEKTHVRTFARGEAQRRAIVTKQHCFGCTAGLGSSCGGAVVDT